MSGSPSISVIVPAHNEERHLARALRSILRQDMPADNYEVIVIDDCSKDNTAKVLELFASDVVAMRNETQLGLPGTLNRGIKRARGKYLIRLDADDYVRQDYLSIMHRFLEDNGHMDAVACDYLEVDENENVLVRRNCVEHPIGCGIMFRLDHLIDIGLYDDSFLLHEDRDLRIRFSSKYQIHRIELPLYRYRQHAGNMTSNVEAWNSFEQRLKAKHDKIESKS